MDRDAAVTAIVADVQKRDERLSFAADDGPQP